MAVTVARPARRAARKKVPGTGIATYAARRDFAATAEPAPRAAQARAGGPTFVVQKHDATRLHWDFRLEHDGVLWSWAVPKGPSLDPHDKRLAVHVEDHPLDYAQFHGTIPEGQYGAGTVEIWDQGTWRFAGPTVDAGAAMAEGEIKFVLSGTRLRGGFVLVRLKPRPRERAENWLLIKERDGQERDGADAAAMEAEIRPPRPATARGVWHSDRAPDPPVEPAPTPAPRRGKVPGAVAGRLPRTQQPQLATLMDDPPDTSGWLSEVKFDGYRMLARVEDGRATLISRNGNDWTARLPRLAEAVAALPVQAALLDGELVALRADGVSDFAMLKDALSEGRETGLVYYVFDLMHLDGQDLRPAKLSVRKQVLRSLSDWSGRLRYSDHLEDDAALAETRRQACAMKLEGIIAKRADSPYRGGRSRNWIKLKCHGREEFVVLGWTPPAGTRTGLGALHLGYHTPDGALHYAGGVGTGFSDQELADLRHRLDALAAPPPKGLLFAGDPIDRRIAWVKPELVGEVQYMAWTGQGRLRHAVWLGLREDKAARDVVRDLADPAAERHARGGAASRARIVRPASKAIAARTVVAAKPAGGESIAGVRVSHAGRELWPGITKRDLAEYWIAVADRALPEIAGRPLALVRCPEGIDGEHFFQKHGKPGFPRDIRAGESDGSPWLAVDDVRGLVSCAQVSAIELHAWGAGGDDPLHPDRLVFDLDPGEGVGMAALALAARDVKARLAAAGLAAFCRTSGGKGLHVVAPLVPRADWDAARVWARGFAEGMAADSPGAYVAAVRKSLRSGRILVDWLRNGLGATAIASLSPRARPGAHVAMPVDWKEVGPKLDPAAFTLRTLPERLRGQRRDPWQDFSRAAAPLPSRGKR